MKALQFLILLIISSKLFSQVNSTGVYNANIPIYTLTSSAKAIAFVGVKSGFHPQKM